MNFVIGDVIHFLASHGQITTGVVQAVQGTLMHVLEPITGLMHIIQPSQVQGKAEAPVPVLSNKPGPVVTAPPGAVLLPYVPPQENATEASRARKDDQTKLDLSLVPIEAQEAVARAMMYGAQKYGRGNYRKSAMEWTRLASAALRHITAWLFVSTLDPESGNSHLDHALASLAMLAFQVKHHPEADNRDLQEASNVSPK